MTNDSKTEVEDTAKIETPDANRDPISGEPGSHPVGTGIGSAGGAAAGAGIGAVLGGPIGAIVGGVVGAVAGGAAGHVAGEALDPTVEQGYWRQNYASRPYAKSTSSYDDYEPAYRYGWESAGHPDYNGRSWDEVESELGRKWESVRGTSRHAWDEAKAATRDSWNRIRGLS
ncbi:MAG: hypothetical protein ABIT01_10955 [Thermoanaerobaculia bacterium]